MTSDPIAAPQRDVGLCLSGGGYRAAVFHLGSLIKINEAGLLSRLRTVSSVSGGSIIAAFLGLRWDQLQFDPDGRASNLQNLIIDPVLEFTGRGLDVGAVLTSAFIPGSDQSPGPEAVSGALRRGHPGRFPRQRPARTS